MSGGKYDEGLFRSADWYDRTINWSARLTRELPVLIDVFGPPGDGGILDAGCGTGHQTHGMAQHGYRVVGIDASDEMLEIARSRGRGAGSDATFHCAPYATALDAAGGGFDGVYCLGNALAAAGTAAGVADAVDQFSCCLRAGGRLFVQILNFEPMRSELPCVRGPRVTQVDGRTYVSVRHFTFGPESATVTNVTIFEDDGWKQRAHSGTLYPAGLAELQGWCGAAGIKVDAVWGNYDRDAFDITKSTDLILVGTKE